MTELPEELRKLTCVPCYDCRHKDAMNCKADMTPYIEEWNGTWLRSSDVAYWLEEKRKELELTSLTTADIVVEDRENPDYDGNQLYFRKADFDAVLGCERLSGLSSTPASGSSEKGSAASQEPRSGGEK